MSLRLGDIAPNFQAKTSLGEIDFYEYLGDSWGILFSHPADYTPVCTTELGRTAALKDEFAKRNTKVLALSVDPVDQHLGWISDINETQIMKVSDEFGAEVVNLNEIYDFDNKDKDDMRVSINGNIWIMHLMVEYFNSVRYQQHNHKQEKLQKNV